MTNDFQSPLKYVRMACSNVQISNIIANGAEMYNQCVYLFIPLGTLVSRYLKSKEKKTNRISALTLTSFGDFTSESTRIGYETYTYQKEKKTHIIQRQRTIHIHISTEDIIYIYIL